MPRFALFLLAAVLTACAPETDEGVDEDESAQTQNAAPLEVGSKLNATVNLRLRSEPIKRKDTIKLVMTKGSEVEVLEAETKNGFAHVKYRNEKEQKDEDGWAWRSYLRGGTTAEAPSSSPEKRVEPEKTSSPGSSGTCRASFYTDEFEDNRTTNGETFHQSAMTAARQSPNFDNIFPFSPEGKNTVRITNLANKKSVDVRINDSGPLPAQRCLDLSKSAFEAIADLKDHTIDVKYERID
jgi:rare lipoprotein A